jgi:hypothetical protein
MEELKWNRKKLDCLYHEAKSEEDDEEEEEEEDEKEEVYYITVSCKLKLLYYTYFSSSANFYIQLKAVKEFKRIHSLESSLNILP